MHPVHYMCKETNKPNKNIVAMNLEVLAVVEAVKKFRIYLLGIKFKIVTYYSELEGDRTLVIPKGMEMEIIKLAHEEVHFGVQKNFEIILHASCRYISPFEEIHSSNRLGGLMIRPDLGPCCNGQGAVLVLRLLELEPVPYHRSGQVFPVELTWGSPGFSFAVALDSPDSTVVRLDVNSFAINELMEFVASKFDGKCFLFYLSVVLLSGVES
ncbi:hypothetical protein LAZ67_X000905 [Cordylochernes scorpioides]|uniref:Reverse transcriptase RNase H-like domain-containing protein n=1 Tax=Cordylochernes scorpioides TaxID=51811 RepID=A0ABY6LS20_9ARAC|nr:hypothetical protein LAZ67_X000905 [Cordylochernes scorpioides]